MRDFRNLIGMCCYSHLLWLIIGSVLRYLPCVSFACFMVLNRRGKGAMQKKVSALRELRRLLSRSEFPPIEAALKAGAIPLLVQCLSFGSPDEQVILFFLGIISRFQIIF